MSTFNYDITYDTLYISFADRSNSYGVDVGNGWVVTKDIETEEITGITIFDAKKKYQASKLDFSDSIRVKVGPTFDIIDGQTVIERIGVLRKLTSAEHGHDYMYRRGLMDALSILDYGKPGLYSGGGGVGLAPPHPCVTCRGGCSGGAGCSRVSGSGYGGVGCGTASGHGGNGHKL